MQPCRPPPPPTQTAYWVGEIDSEPGNFLYKYKVIFVISFFLSATALDILEARENKAHELKHLITHLPPHLGNSNITAVIPTDFNGDALMDVLLTTQPAGDPNSKLTILIYWGTDEGHVQRLDGE